MLKKLAYTIAKAETENLHDFLMMVEFTSPFKMAVVR